MNINVKKTILNAVNVNDEFPFYVDELSKNNTMPTSKIGRASCRERV